jgi:hypothetical protein
MGLLPKFDYRLPITCPPRLIAHPSRAVGWYIPLGTRESPDEVIE